MYIIEHALLNLGKYKGRNTLLAAIILVIITATVVALAIFNTANASIEDTRLALQCAVRISPQRQTPAGGIITSEGGQQEGSLTLEQYLSFAESTLLDGADIKEGGRGADSVDAVYYLKRPDLLPAFEAEIRAKGLPDSYIARTDEGNLERMAGSLQSLKNLSLSFLLIVLLLGAIIMVLLSAIAVRERKYEIGVLRAMGMMKHKVALGLWTEIVTITCLCFVLGLGMGSLLSQPVCDAIMAGQAQTAAAGSSSLADRLSEASGVAEATTGIAISVDAITALEIFAVSVLLASIAGLVSVSRITKSEPMRILMDRN